MKKNKTTNNGNRKTSIEKLSWETGEPPIDDELMVECDMAYGNVERWIVFLD